MTKLRLLPLVVAALLTACQGAPQPAAPPALVGPGGPAVAGKAQLVVAPSVLKGATRQLLEVITAYTDLSINHLVVRLYKLDTAPDPDEWVDTLQFVDVPGSEVYNAISFTNLDKNSTYRVRAFAYKSAGTSEKISADATSYVDITVTNDDRPTMGNLPIDLISQTFSGESTTTGTTVTPGVVTHSGTEDAASLAALDVDEADTPIGFTGSEHNSVWDVVVDADGNTFYTDPARGVIWTVPSGGGTPTVFAGTLDSAATSVDDTGTAAGFNAPRGLALGPDGKTLYVGDLNAIRKVTNPGAAVTTLAGAASGNGDFPVGAGTNANDEDARFNAIADLHVEASGDVYVADLNNHVVRRWNADDDTVDNVSDQTTLSEPSALTRGPDNKLYVADRDRGAIYRLWSNTTPALVTGQPGDQSYADGDRTVAKFTSPRGLAFDAAGWLYVADGNLVRKVSLRGDVFAFAGDPGTGGGASGTLYQAPGDYGTATFSFLSGLALHDGQLFTTSAGGKTIRRLFKATL